MTESGSWGHCASTSDVCAFDYARLRAARRKKRDSGNRETADLEQLAASQIVEIVHGATVVSVVVAAGAAFGAIELAALFSALPRFEFGRVPNTAA